MNDVTGASGSVLVVLQLTYEVIESKFVWLQRTGCWDQFVVLMMNGKVAETVVVVVVGRSRSCSGSTST